MYNCVPCPSHPPFNLVNYFKPTNPNSEYQLLIRTFMTLLDKLRHILCLYMTNNSVE